MNSWIVLGSYVGDTLVAERRVLAGAPYGRIPWEKVIRIEQEWTEAELKARFRKCRICKRHGVHEFT